MKFKSIAIFLVLSLALGLCACTDSERKPGESAGQDLPPAASLNVLRGDPIPCSSDGYPASGIVFSELPVFGSEYLRNQIRSVTFLNSLSDMPAEAWDVSEAADGSVMAWTEPSGKLYDLYIGAEGTVKAGSSCLGIFAGYCNVQQINFGDCFCTKNAVDMSFMFYDCDALETLNLSSFDTGSVKSMRAMFKSCYALETLDIHTLDTSSVVDLQEMFFHCKSLRKLDLSSFNTAKAMDMSGLFWGCERLQKLDVSGFDTSNTGYMSYMFSDCRSLKELDLSNFDTKWTMEMDSMFSDCEKLQKLDLSSFDTKMVNSMSYMFSGCHSLTELDLSSFSTKNLESTENMFLNCPAGDDWSHLLK